MDQGPGGPVVLKIPCVNLCVKNVPKSAKMYKIDKNVEFIFHAITEIYII
jgi:hypothetical protein